MSRIDELIDELCPEGVEYKTLGECISRNIGGGTPSRSVSGYWGGDIPWASVGDLTISGNFIETTRASITAEGLKSSPCNVVSRGDVIVAVKISPGKMKIAANDIAINQDLRGLTLHDFIDSSFLTYYSQTISIVGNGTIVKGITTGTLERVKIPVPPIDVQREIVKVLDSFMALEAELKAELEAELQTRRQQYEYYRDALFASSDRGFCRSTMAEVGEFFRGRRFTKNDFDPEGIACIHYGDIYTQYGTATEKTVSYVRADMGSALRFAQPGDLVIAGVGETVEDVGKAVAWLGEGEVAIHDDCFAFRHSLNPKFVAHYFQTTAFHGEKSKFVARAKVKRLSSESLGKLAIPVPPAEEQERIVAILDQLEALVNDLSVELPSELKARRQQYSHYRARLLTFKEIA